MTALLTDNLPLLAGAPNGIKKLRELILELALRGKLVEQDASNEPASELLKRIVVEKARLVAEGKLKKQKPLVEIAEEEKPFELPAGWEWARFGSVLDYFSDTPQPGYVQLIQIRDLGERPQPVYIPRELASKFCTSNDIMVGRYGASVGKTFWGKEGSYNVALVKMVDEHNIFYKGFLYQLLKSPLGQSYFLGISRSAQDGFNKSDIEQKLVPILPLAEQHRIVAKVDELMALCDRLEAQQCDAASAHAQLVQALLGSLTQTSDATEFAANWQRLAEHFHTLFSTEPSIDALKQTLLQLAVMGKLVPQDPTDEPASELLKRISAESQRLVAEGKLKKRKPLAENLEADSPYDIPGTWAWARLEDIAYVFSGNAFKSEDFQDTPGIKVIKITNAGVGELIKTEDYLPVGHGCEHESFRVLQDDLILALTRPYISTGLKVSRCPAEYDGALLNQRVASIRLSSEVDNEFGFLFFKSPIVLTIYQERFGNSGLQPNLKMSDVTSLLIPIPPGEEQRRIVAKVDQLMALCDQLKTQLSQARQLNQQLASTLVEQAVA
jgi:type I restriction enzyme S subunit